MQDEYAVRAGLCRAEVRRGNPGMFLVLSGWVSGFLKIVPLESRSRPEIDNSFTICPTGPLRAPICDTSSYPYLILWHELFNANPGSDHLRHGAVAAGNKDGLDLSTLASTNVEPHIGPFQGSTSLQTARFKVPGHFPWRI